MQRGYLNAWIIVARAPATTIPEMVPECWLRFHMIIIKLYWSKSNFRYIILKSLKGFLNFIGCQNWIKVRTHLYVNTNEACGTEVNLNECQKVVCLAFTYLNAHPASQTNFSLKYRLQMDSIQLFTNIRCINELSSLRLSYTSTSTFLSFPHTSFGIRIQTWMQCHRWVLCGATPFFQCYQSARCF